MKKFYKIFFIWGKMKKNAKRCIFYLTFGLKYGIIGLKFRGGVFMDWSIMLFLLMCICWLFMKGLIELAKIRSVIGRSGKGIGKNQSSIKRIKRRIKKEVENEVW